jgi:hypothetical protein
MEAARPENVALFDMDGTLCDYERKLLKDLKRLRAPNEPDFAENVNGLPEHIRRRADAIRASQDWWAKLPKLQLGWDVLGVAQELKYRIMILTQGPKWNPAAWTGKKLWIDRNLGPDVDITITRDKGLVYGKVLVDDWPPYVESWLAWRRNGLAIMPANRFNEGYSHDQVIRYDGKNLDEVRWAMEMRLSAGTEFGKLLRDSAKERRRLAH